MKALEYTVSVAVGTFNSAKTIVETLNSIYSQTYKNLELIISDDCSTDNTVEICRRWISCNQSRFVRTSLIVSKNNLGTSANGNLSEQKCTGKWVKPISGDDILVNDCIENCVKYLENHNEFVLLFGKCKSFGADKNKCNQVDGIFDYSFFSLSKEEQLDRLVFQFNCIPASTFFYDREKYMSLGIKNDERIPLVEDWPKWINLLRKGISFGFLDKVIVYYRIGGISTNSLVTVDLFRSDRLFYFYYLFPEWCKQDYDYAITRMVSFEVDMYKTLREIESKSEAEIREERDILIKENEYLKRQIFSRVNSKSYKLGRLLLHPISVFAHKFIKNKII